jgi:hypothetical protein
MPATTVASLAPLPDAQSFHAALVADLAPCTPLEHFFANQAARAATALQQLAADPTADLSPTLTTENRLSTLLSRALRELRLLQSDRRKRERDTQTAAPAAPRLPSPGPADASATPNTATRPEEGGCERQTTTASADTPATPPVKPSPLTPQYASALANPSPPLFGAHASARPDSPHAPARGNATMIPDVFTTNRDRRSVAAWTQAG